MTEGAGELLGVTVGTTDWLVDGVVVLDRVAEAVLLLDRVGVDDLDEDDDGEALSDVDAVDEGDKVDVLDTLGVPVLETETDTLIVADSVTLLLEDNDFVCEFEAEGDFVLLGEVDGEGDSDMLGVSL